eukprot:TRINITY_DN26757_c0_g1_i1.p1 TRINITY_DN26757_c0_g1~~TRINITY_DN26757_c0_g1_i1.p1  ORF type:complete len:194 (-),score=37.30 TRINITY_DN26757_c0_g1_i1:19-558(-)
MHLHVIGLSLLCTTSVLSLEVVEQGIIQEQQEPQIQAHERSLEQTEQQYYEQVEDLSVNHPNHAYPVADPRYGEPQHYAQYRSDAPVARQSPRQTFVAWLTGMFRSARKTIDNFTARMRANRRLDAGIHLITSLIDRLVPPSPERLARSDDSILDNLDNNSIAKAVAISTFVISGILAI